MSIEINKKSLSSLIAAVIFGSVVTLTATSFFGDSSSPDTNANHVEKKPIYWVAPMDANYKKDKPGKSPMGMDLIPVYDDGASGAVSGPGTIKISPEVVNNLGVRTAMVKYASLHSKISTVGYVKYDEDQLIHIHPRVQGWIEKLYVKAAGDPVVKAQPLYEIYSPALVNAQEELLLALDRKNQRLIQAAEERLYALQLPKKAISQLKKMKKVKQRITFYAPQNGVIDNLNIREGFYVKPGTTIMSIGKLDQVWVEAEVFERQVSEVKVGLPVTMTLGYLPNKQWKGLVDYVYPTLNAKNRTVKVRLRFENKNKILKPNMFAQVVIHLQSQQKSLLIPKEALIRSGGSERVVLALGGGRYKSIHVKIGRFDENSVEILSGLVEGEKVVSSAQFLLDSESSKSSDFKRMNSENTDEVKLSNTSNTSKQKEINSADASGVINSIMLSHRMLNISRGPIEAWGRDAATLDFLVSKELDMSSLTKDSEIQFTFHLSDGVFIITQIKNKGK